MNKYEEQAFKIIKEKQVNIYCFTYIRTMNKKATAVSVYNKQVKESSRKLTPREFEILTKAGF